MSNPSNSTDDTPVGSGLADAIVEMSQSVEHPENFNILCTVMETYLASEFRPQLEMKALESYANAGEAHKERVERTAQREHPESVFELTMLGKPTGQSELYTTFRTQIYPDDIAKLDGFIQKSASNPQISPVIFRVYDGNQNSLTLYYICKDRDRFKICTLNADFSEEISEIIQTNFQLSASELLVVRGLMNNLSVKDIAEETGKSTETVRSQLKSVANKFGLSKQQEITNAVHNIRKIWLENTTAKPKFQHSSCVLKLSDDRQILYDIIGARDGQPVLYLHDFSSGRHWTDQAKAYFEDANLQVVSWSRPGFDASNIIEKTGTELLENLVMDCHALIEELGFSKVKLLCVGTGFAIAYHLALRFPDTIEKIVGLNIYPPILRHNDAMQFTKGLYRTGVLTALHAPKTHRLISKIAAKGIENAKTVADLSSVVGGNELGVQEGDALFDQAIKPNVDGIRMSRGEGAWRDVTFLVTDWAISDEPFDIRSRTVLFGHEDFPFFNMAHVKNFAQEFGVPYTSLAGNFREIFMTPTPITEALNAQS